MRIMALILFTLLHFTIAAQTISYDIPEGYETTISKEDYKKLVDEAVTHVAKRYIIEVVKDGTITLKKGQEMQGFNLHNLIDKCAAVTDKSQWKDVIKTHFENMFAALDEQKKIDPDDFGTVKKYLSLRIYPVAIVQQRGGSSTLVTRTDLEGTFTVVMLDLPGAFAALQKDTFLKWKIDSATVFKIAQENINKQQVEKVTQGFDIEGAKIDIHFLGDENYAASFALDIEHNAPEFLGDWGSVIAIPNKGLVNICKITKDKPLDFVKFIQRLKPLIEKSYTEHPQRISDQFFWYYHGTFTKINLVTNADGAINVIAPMGLGQLMTEKK